MCREEQGQVTGRGGKTRVLTGGQMRNSRLTVNLGKEGSGAGEKGFM